MKSYTDLEQSKKLAEILPIETADMRYAPFGDTHPWFREGDLIEKDSIPCWSLSALLGVLDIEINSEFGEIYQLNIEKYGTLWNVSYKELFNRANPIETESTEDLVDACYEMILKLHEQKLL